MRVQAADGACNSMANPDHQSTQDRGLVGDIPAILLVGGKGTRLQSVVRSKPKPLAQIGDAPFLELLVLQLRAQGIRRIVMSTGHLAEQIEQQFQDGRKLDMRIEYSRETQPLGTAGAVKFASGLVTGAAEFLVMNGDSFLEFSVSDLIHFHRKHRGVASMAVRRVPNSARFGTVHISESRRIAGFVEKTGAEVPGVVNGGVYVFDQSFLGLIPDGPSSLEKDVFPHVLDRGIYALEQHGLFIDIGTPEDYAYAQGLRDRLHQVIASETQLTPEGPRP